MQRLSSLILAFSALAACNGAAPQASTVASDVTPPTSPAACAVLDFAAPADGIQVNRCATKAQGGEGYDQLRVEISGTNGPNGRTGARLALASGVKAWVKLNGHSRTFPMSCRQSVSGSNGASGSCVVTISNFMNASIPAHEGPFPTSGFFDDARRDDATILNAWDVELAFVAADGEWDSRDGANYAARFAEVAVGEGTTDGPVTYENLCGRLRTYLPGGVTDPSVGYRNGLLTLDSGLTYTMELLGARDFDGDYCVYGTLDSGRHFTEVVSVAPR
jgi:hypothetical protein